MKMYLFCSGQKTGICGPCWRQIHNKFKRRMYTRSGKFKAIPGEEAKKMLLEEGRNGIDYLLEEKSYLKWTQEENKKYA